MTSAIVRPSPSLAPCRHRALTLAVFAAVGSISTSGFAAMYTVSNTNNAGAGSLRQAILDANASGAYAGIVSGSNIINVTTTGTINLSDALPMVFSNVAINGNGISIDGGDAHRCFFISGLPTAPNGSSQPIAVSLQNMNLAHCRAKGGDGGSSGWGGGGGMGAGGALFINTSASVTLNSVNFDGNSAVGGNGGSVASGGASGGGGGGLGGAGGGLGGSGTGGGFQGCLDGGGGLGGDGGTGYCTADGHGGSGGGGGAGGNGGNGSPSGTGGGGGGGGFGGSGIGQISSNQGFNTAGSGYPGLAGGANGGGGGGGGIGGTGGQSGTLAGTGGTGGGMASGGGGGGITGSAGTADNGGSGGIGGGGGGSILVNSAGNASAGGFGGGGAFGGSGGFGGGGGAQGNGGFGGGGGGGFSAGGGGFGGGGGGSSQNIGASGGFGGGAGGSGGSGSYPNGGGGGAGLGGAIFVVGGGALSIDGTGSLTAGQVTGGTAGTGAANDGAPGSAFGKGAFLQGNGTLTFNLGNGALYTLSDGISDVQGSGGGNNSGSWGMNVVGDGTGAVVLGAANTYTGATEVASGALEIDGSVTSLTTVDAAGVLVGIGTAANVLNNGVVAPGNATTSLITGQPPGNYRFTVANYSQGSGARLDIGLDGSGDSTQLAVTNAAGLDGRLHLQFDESPAPGTTYTVLTAASISGTFADYRTNMPSVFGEISYASHSVLFTVLGNDLIFRDGFEGSNAVATGTCISKQQFAAIPGSTLDGLSVCVPPFTTTISGNTIIGCQTSMCPGAVAGCPTTLRAGSGTLSGTLASGAYTIDTPITADTISAPLNISGSFGDVNCTATASNITADLAVQYAAAADYLGDAFIYSLESAQTNNLNSSLSSSGCGLYGSFIPLAQPYVLQQIQTQVNSVIADNLASGIKLEPGVGDTICPAP